MWYACRYRAYPNWTGVTAEAQRHIDIYRQLYNRVKWDYEQAPEDDKPIEYSQNNKLPEWKRRWPVFAELHSKPAQETVARFHDNLSSLKGKKENGGKVGRLKRQCRSVFRSVTYNQSGFDLDDKRGRNWYAHVRFSKIGWIPIRYHHDLPDYATVKEVNLKQDRSGAWYVMFGIEVEDEDLPEKPALDELDTGNSVGIDLSILNCIHTLDGLTVDTLDLEDEYEWLQKAQRTLLGRERGSNNWEKQRKRVAKLNQRIRRKVLNFQHKLTTWLVKTYDAVFVEVYRDANTALNMLQRGFSELGWDGPKTRLWRLRPLLRRLSLSPCLQVASSKQEASGLDPETIHELTMSHFYG